MNDPYSQDWMLRDDPMAPMRLRRGIRNGLVLSIPLLLAIAGAIAAAR
ncbi:hypothetical protein [Croceicoccus gelatinilyticus]|nr:hypothetical protein [Croceicoccus gelatinilyticus]MBS7669369.1 hypothetical protein [Croceicoccus gelatinilyticus]